MAAERRAVRRIVGVYDADGTWWGEVSYFVGSRLGRRHCALCDITHGTFGEKGEWRRGRDALPVPFECFHRDDQPAPVRAAAGGIAPVVVAEFADGEHVVLLGPDDLERCAGSVEAFAGMLGTALDGRAAGPG